MVNLSNLDTEKTNVNTKNIDRLDTLEMVKLINSEDKKVANAIETALPAISQAIDAIYEKMKTGGRLIYAGAGTSGRLAVLDAAECPPTFGVDYNTVVGLLAGGQSAFIKAVEGAEDNPKLGAEDLAAINFTASDVLVGVAASGRTPYVIGALDYANSLNAVTIALSCTQNAKIAEHAKINIAVTPGPEVITGSTRLKSGTAQKMVLNMLSTATMIKLGKVYGNLMVDVRATNEKLIQRTKNIVCQATGVSEETATATLEKCNFSAKNAIVMILAKVDHETAQTALNNANGRIYLALEQLK
ncbi:MAG: N-acetylmuramic acid 6-phosphate etherase [Firmicutes bacterium]|nr:N-acetylmuramic acid 6-phosphate etherase [Bacillota bacterium]